MKFRKLEFHPFMQLLENVLLLNKLIFRFQLYFSDQVITALFKKHCYVAGHSGRAV
jgi:hypothetical protein